MTTETKLPFVFLERYLLWFQSTRISCPLSKTQNTGRGSSAIIHPFPQNNLDSLLKKKKIINLSTLIQKKKWAECHRKRVQKGVDSGNWGYTQKKKMREGNIFSDMDQNRQQTCLLSVSLAFCRNCSQGRQKSRDMASKLPVSGQFRRRKTEKEWKWVNSSNSQRNKARLRWSTLRWGWGREGLRKEVKGGNEIMKIQKVLSCIEEKDMTIVHSSASTAFRCWMQVTFQNINSNLCRPLQATPAQR